MLIVSPSPTQKHVMIMRINRYFRGHANFYLMGNTPPRNSLLIRRRIPIRVVVVALVVMLKQPLVTITGCNVLTGMHLQERITAVSGLWAVWLTCTTAPSTLRRQNQRFFVDYCSVFSIEAKIKRKTPKARQVGWRDELVGLRISIKTNQLVAKARENTRTVRADIFHCKSPVRAATFLS